MSKLQDIRNLAQEHAVSVSSSPGNWMDYMDTASRLYRYSFSDQLLIHLEAIWNDSFCCEDHKVLQKEYKGRKIGYTMVVGRKE